jgi:D-inositol-3-phosphate glycosyltransferase
MRTSRRRRRILVVGHGAAASGFARIVHALVEHLSDRYELVHFATNHRTARVEGAWPIFGNDDALDVHGLERLEELVLKLRPDAVLMLHDLWFCSIHARRLAARSSIRPLTIAYAPVDGSLTRPELYSCLGLLDQIVAYNGFGRSQLAKISFEHEPLERRCALGRIAEIPHGVDGIAFRPLSPHGIADRRHAKRLLFGEDVSAHDFVVLNASKNESRKRVDVAIDGFARFARDKPPGVKLHLHMHAASEDGVDVRALARRAGIAERVIWTRGWLDGHPSVDDAELNVIYTAADVGLNTSGGEGWGLVSCEHAATGAPQVVPRHSGCGELWRTTQTTLPVHESAEHVGLGMMRRFVSAADVAAVLDRLYRDAAFRREQAHESYRVATCESYRWANVATRWSELIDNVLAGTRTPAARRREGDRPFDA